VEPAFEAQYEVLGRKQVDAPARFEVAAIGRVVWDKVGHHCKKYGGMDSELAQESVPSELIDR